MEEIQEIIQDILLSNPKIVMIAFGQHGAIKVEGFFSDSKGENIPYNLPFKNMDAMMKFLETLNKKEKERTNSKLIAEGKEIETPVKTKSRKNIGGFASMNTESILEEIK